jgi:hypothetical protein
MVTCHHCGRSTDDAYIRPYGTTRLTRYQRSKGAEARVVSTVLICPDCVATWVYVAALSATDAVMEAPCPGDCGVTMRWRPSEGTALRPCSPRCRMRLRRIEGRDKPRDLTRHCWNCRESFTPTRKDARTCSPRCRVARHRRLAAQHAAEKMTTPTSPGTIRIPTSLT